jgi:hypothetical protein
MKITLRPAAPASAARTGPGEIVHRISHQPRRSPARSDRAVVSARIAPGLSSHRIHSPMIVPVVGGPIRPAGGPSAPDVPSIGPPLGDRCESMPGASPGRMASPARSWYASAVRPRKGRRPCFLPWTQRPRMSGCPIGIMSRPPPRRSRVRPSVTSYYDHKIISINCMTS